jgi:hypothetical protein
MPAFSEAYADEEIASVVAFLRTFCPKADAYPPGDLNFRRLLQTGKAFPEVEVVLRASHTPAEEDRQTGLEVLYENRLGTRFQYELVLPLSFQAPHDATGVGDIEIEGKQVLHFDLRRLQILSAGLGVTFPSGDDEKGLGAGTTVFTPFLSYGKGWGRRGRTFAQARLAAKIPAESDKSDPEVRWAAALSRALGPARIAWTPALELAGVWNTETGDHDWDVFLEVSKPLNRLGHVIAAGGVRIPVQPSDAHVSIEAYLLWDFGDGPFWAGW